MGKFVIYIGITLEMKSVEPKSNDYFILLWSMKVLKKAFGLDYKLAKQGMTFYALVNLDTNIEHGYNTCIFWTMKRSYTSHRLTFERKCYMINGGLLGGIKCWMPIQILGLWSLIGHSIGNSLSHIPLIPPLQ